MITFETTVSTMQVYCNECKRRTCFMTVLQNEYSDDEKLLGELVQHRCPFLAGKYAEFKRMVKRQAASVAEESGRIVLNDMSEE